ncbi:amidase family protein [Bacillus daqingensis]|uniref:Amidase family protein n=1 Tax=Bacillus daqingensis TaxID=872396 RepID=A0ABV9NTB7_9BACI
MRVDEYRNMDATALAAGLKSGDVRTAEVQAAAEKTIQQWNPLLNAIVRRVQPDVEQDGPFAGVPFVVKDISQAIKGVRLSAGSKLLTAPAAADSHLVRKWRQAGLRIIGQTNTPEFGLKNITEPKTFGATRNPHDMNRSPGGSSGGAAAAVAAGMVPAAGASDGGGSIRIPASFSGLVGLKPTRGRTPVGPGAGRQWQGAAIDFVLTRTVRDCASLLQASQTFQPEAAFPWPTLPEAAFALRDPAKSMRIAFSLDSPVGTTVSFEAQESVRRAVSFLEEQGHAAEEQQPDIDGRSLMRNYYTMNAGEMRSVVQQLEQAGLSVDGSGLELESWMLQEAGRYVDAAAYSNSLKSWDETAARMQDFHDTFDLYITPATASRAPLTGELTKTTEEEERMRERMLHGGDRLELIEEMFEPSLCYTPFTQLANLSGQPAISIPAGSDRGMPLGIQVMAAKGREDLLLQTASLFERSFLWTQSLPARPGNK